MTICNHLSMMNTHALLLLLFLCRSIFASFVICVALCCSLSFASMPFNCLACNTYRSLCFGSVLFTVFNGSGLLSVAKKKTATTFVGFCWLIGWKQSYCLWNISVGVYSIELFHCARLWLNFKCVKPAKDDLNQDALFTHWR